MIKRQSNFSKKFVAFLTVTAFTFLQILPNPQELFADPMAVDMNINQPTPTVSATDNLIEAVQETDKSETDTTNTSNFLMEDHPLSPASDEMDEVEKALEAPAGSENEANSEAVDYSNFNRLSTEQETPGKIFYVDGSVSASGDGTKLSSPWKALSQVDWDLIQPGDTLYLRAGTYTESLEGIIPSGESWDRPVTIAGYPGEDVILKPTGTDQVLRFEDGQHHIVIDNLILDGANARVDTVKITKNVTAAHHIRIQNSEIRNAPRQGILLTGGANYNEFINLDIHDNGHNDFDHGIYIETDHNLIDGVRSYRNAGWGIHLYHEEAADTSYNIVRNNVTYENGQAGRGVGIGIYTGEGNQAYNNISYDNKIGISVNYGAVNTKIYNNTVYGNAESGIVIGSGSTDADIRNNISYGNSSGNYSNAGVNTTSATNLFGVDPKFVNAAEGNFNLLTGSPAINAGSNLTSSGFTHDLDQKLRSTSWDIGAHEYFSSSIIGPAEIEIASVTSSSITLNWDKIENASQIRIYISPEPSETLNGDLPEQFLFETLEGSETSYQFKNLAPSANFFIRFVIETPEGMLVQNLHRKTLGGPRETLDGSIRSVESIAPNMLMLVLENKGVDFNEGKGVLNDKGADWQGGTWKIKRKDGTWITVKNVYRHSVPVGQPVYTLGYGADYRLQNSDIVDVDHHIYLELDENILESLGGSEILGIIHEGNPGTNMGFVMPVSDKYMETPLIQVNQLGYNPASTERWAYVSHWRGDGGGLNLDNFPAFAEVIRESDNPMEAPEVVVANLPITWRSTFDPDTGAPVKQIDLSSVPVADGVRYRVRIPGIGVSYLTSVSNYAPVKAFYTALRGLYLNRWGRDLDCQYTDWCGPNPDHTTIYTGENTGPYFNDENMPRTGERTLQGGHHDAGDFDIRRSHTVIAQLLLRAFELSPNKFTDGQLDIPESGNGIPDLLDEALWSIEGWRQLQEADGGVRSGVESWKHPWGYYHADQEPSEEMPYWTFARDPDVTARAAALFAQASRLVAPYNAQLAQDLLKDAVKAWQYAVDANHQAASAPLLYASSELFQLTGEAQYKNAFESLFVTHFLADWNNDGPSAHDGLKNVLSRDLQWSEYEVGQTSAMADYLLGYALSPGANAMVSTIIKNNIHERAANSLWGLEEEHAHRSNHGDLYDWGYGAAPSRNLMMVFASLQLGVSEERKQEYINALSLNADNMLGSNPAGMVWMTGLGTRSPEEPLHLDSLAFIKEGLGPMPGIPVYGPIQSSPGQSYYEPSLSTFYPYFEQQPNMLRYADTKSFVTTNEFTTWEMMAPIALLYATLLPEDVEVPDTWKPGQACHTNTYADLCGATTTPNESPVISVIASQTLQEDATSGNISFTINDAETNSDQLVISASSSNQTLIDASGIVISGTGSARTITLTPKSNASGNAIITILVRDADHNLTQQTFNLTVNPVADIPTATLTTLTGVSEDTVRTFSLTGSDADGNPLTYSIVSQPTKGTLTCAESNCKYVSKGNYNGADSFTYKVNDGTSDSDPVTINFNVTAVNDAPILKIDGQTIPSEPILVSAFVGQATTLDFAAADADVPPSHNYQIISGSLPGMTLTNSTGLFTWTPAVAQQGLTQTVRIRVTDGIYVSEFDVTFKVQAPLTAEARIFHVSQSGSGDFSMIQSCARVARAGDTCLVASGNYQEYVATKVHGSEGKYVHFKADGQVTLYGFSVDHRYSWIDGFEFTKYQGTEHASITVHKGDPKWSQLDGSYSIIENNTVRDGVFRESSNIVIQDNGDLEDTITVPEGGLLAAGFVAGGTVRVGAPEGHPTANSGITKRKIKSVTDTVITLEITENMVSEGPVYAVLSAPKSALMILSTGPEIAPTHITIRGNNFYNIFGQGIVFYGSNHLIEKNTFERFNGYDMINFVGHDVMIRDNYFKTSPAMPGNGNHPDVIQTFGSGDQTVYNITFEHNFVENFGGQAGILESDGRSTVHDIKIINNVFANIDYSLQVGVPNVEFSGNTVLGTFVAYYDGDKAFGGDGDNSDGGILKKNVFLDNRYGYNIGVRVDMAEVSQNFIAGLQLEGFPGGNPKVQNLSNPVGADGIPFTDDDGLIPLEGSPLCANGMGAYACKAVSAPIAVIDMNKTSGYEPIKVYFNGSLSFVPAGHTVVEYLWDFGNGETATGENVIHTFMEGNHNIKLTLKTEKDGNEYTHQVIRTLEVLHAEHPNLNFYLDLNDNVTDQSGKGLSTEWTTQPGYLDTEIPQLGKAAAFDQNNHRGIIAPDNPMLENFEAMTISFWAKKNATNESNNVVNKFTAYSVNILADGLSATLAGKTITVKGNNQDTNWHHYSVTYDGTMIRIYIDGIEAGSLAASGIVEGTSAGQLVIGRVPWAESFDGAMDEVRIYDRNLSTNEIEQLYANVTLPEVHLIANTQSASLNEDGTKLITLSGRYSDNSPLASETYTLNLTRGGDGKYRTTHGTLESTADPKVFLYTPNANFNGSDSFTFKVSDGTLESLNATINLTVNSINDVPTLNVINNITINEGAAQQTINLTGISAGPNESETVTVTVTSNNPTLLTNLQVVNNVLSFTPASNRFGNVTVTVTVTDNFGLRVTRTFTVTVNEVNEAPVLNDLNNQNVGENESITVTLSGSDPDGDNLTYSADNLPAGATLVGNVFRWTPGFSQSGNYVVTFTVGDGNLIATKTMNIAVGNVNRAPTINPVSPITQSENSLISINLVSSDPDNDDLTITSNNLPSGAALNGNIFSWTPSFTQAGTYTVTFQVTDGTLSFERNVTITVNNLNRDPVVPMVTVPALDEDSNVVINLGPITDLDADVINLSISGHPTHGTLVRDNADPLKFTYTPNAHFNGSDSLTYRVTDGTSIITRTINLTINSVNDAPEMKVLSAQSVRENQGWSLTLEASDSDREPLIWNAVGMPVGMILKDNQLQWIPDFTQSGSYWFTVTVTDGTEIVSQELEVSVLNQNQIPVLEGIELNGKMIDENEIEFEGEEISLQIIARDSDAEDLRYQAELNDVHTMNEETGEFILSLTKEATLDIQFFVADVESKSDVRIIRVRGQKDAEGYLRFFVQDVTKLLREKVEAKKDREINAALESSSIAVRDEVSKEIKIAEDLFRFSNLRKISLMESFLKTNSLFSTGSSRYRQYEKFWSEYLSHLKDEEKQKTLLEKSVLKNQKANLLTQPLTLAAPGGISGKPEMGNQLKDFMPDQNYLSILEEEMETVKTLSTQDAFINPAEVKAMAKVHQATHAKNQKIKTILDKNQPKK